MLLGTIDTILGAGKIKACKRISCERGESAIILESDGMKRYWFKWLSFKKITGKFEQVNHWICPSLMLTELLPPSN